MSILRRYGERQRFVYTLFYYHDPMCSWCWGYRPVSERLFAALPAEVSLQKILGGLAPDSDVPMSPSQRAAMQGYWQKIEAMLGTSFNYDFWEQCEPRRSTYPACRAVIAAGLQDRADDMIEAIQLAYYLHAMNPSDLATLESLAEQLELDVVRFATELRATETDYELREQIAFARRSPISGFPALVLGRGERLVPLRLDYQNHLPTLEHIAQIRDG